MRRTMLTVLVALGSCRGNGTGSRIGLRSDVSRASDTTEVQGAWQQEQRQLCLMQHDYKVRAAQESKHDPREKKEVEGVGVRIANLPLPVGPQGNQTRSLRGQAKVIDTADLKPLPRKSKAVLILIEMFPPFWVLGVDRFYMGQVGMGLMKMALFVTCGVCGVVWGILDCAIVEVNALAKKKRLDVLGMAAQFQDADVSTAFVLAIVEAILLSCLLLPGVFCALGKWRGKWRKKKLMEAEAERTSGCGATRGVRSPVPKMG